MTPEQPTNPSETLNLEVTPEIEVSPTETQDEILTESESPPIQQPSSGVSIPPIPSPDSNIDNPGDSEPPAATEQDTDAAQEESEFPVTSALSVANVEALAAQKLALQQEISNLEALHAQQLSTQNAALQALIQESLTELNARKASLEADIDKLERRRDRIQQEMRTTFAGASQELAIRVQGFKDYLVGSLQDLVSAADQLELGTGDDWDAAPTHGDPIIEGASAAPAVEFADQGFTSQKQQILNLIDQYRNRPDYYGPPWQLRRTFEPIHADRVRDWFFKLGGRGAIQVLDSRLQNILLGSAIIAILNQLYGDRTSALILAATPDRLGEWRRSLQDCLGISKWDFGPDRGIVLFESPVALTQRAERLVDEQQMPLIIVDEAEEQIDLFFLQFPLLLAFTPTYQQSSNYFY